jgi:hypothetical protein
MRVGFLDRSYSIKKPHLKFGDTHATITTLLTKQFADKGGQSLLVF